MNTLQTALIGLTSQDPIKFDNSYDALLLDDNESLNNDLIDSIETNHNSPELTKTLLQILCFRATQVKNENRWSQRIQGTLTFGRYIHLLLNAAEDVNPELRLEAIQCLSDMFEHNLSEERLAVLLETHPRSIYPLRYPQCVNDTLDTLEHLTNSDVDVNVQLLAANTLKKISKEYSTFRKIGLVDTEHYADLER